MENVFFIVGPHGVGKTYIVNKIKEVANVIHIDLGPLLRETHRVFAPNISFGEWIEKGELKYGKNFTDIILCKQIERLIKGRESERTIITGSRSLNGLKYISTRFKIEEPKVIYIDAPFAQLKQNYEKRENRSLTTTEFEALLQKDRNIGLDTLKQYALEHNTYMQNDNTLNFIQKIRGIVLERKLPQEER